MRKKCNRKVWLKVNPIEHAKYQASLLTQAEWNDQMTPVIAALDRLSRGDWHKVECWQPMFECLNRTRWTVRSAWEPSHSRPRNWQHCGRL